MQKLYFTHQTFLFLVTNSLISTKSTCPFVHSGQRESYPTMPHKICGIILKPYLSTWYSLHPFVQKSYIARQLL